MLLTDLNIMPNMTIEEIQELIKQRAKKNTPFEQTKITFKEKIKAILPVLQSLSRRRNFN